MRHQVLAHLAEIEVNVHLGVSVLDVLRLVPQRLVRHNVLPSDFASNLELKLVDGIFTFPLSVLSSKSEGVLRELSTARESLSLDWTFSAIDI